MNLKGAHILLGITGGIAAYKSCELLRLLQKKGAEVRVAMTDNATQFVAPLTFQSLTKCPVYLKSGSIETRPFRHIDFPRWADIFLVAPCTANMLAKFTYGIADDPVSLCFMSANVPRFIAPAMNVAMYNSPAVKRNLTLLKSFENTFLMEAPKGELACGEVGQGRLLEPAEIVNFIEKTQIEKVAHKEFTPSHSFDEIEMLENEMRHNLPGFGKSVLITAGRTEELIDPVRYISNRSSGKTAVALASVFLAQGFEVHVIAGPMEAEFPHGVILSKVQSARKMHEAVLKKQNIVNALIHCAAVADYRPKKPATEKIKDSRSQLILELEANPNILRDSVLFKKENQVIVGFALETENFEQHAKEKLKKSGANALLLNAPVKAQSGFGFDEVEYALITPEMENVKMQLGSKIALAETIVNFILEKI